MLRPTHVRRLAIALLLTGAFAGSHAASSSGSGGPAAACGNLEEGRDQAAEAGAWNELETLARTYIEQCRAVREKDAIALAMGDLAYVKRATGAWLESLSLAQACINFHYLAVSCHAAKAVALGGLRMPTEAREVVKTGYEVARRATDQAGHDLRTAEAGKAHMSSGDYSDRVAAAKWKLRLAAEGRKSLQQVEAELNSVGGAK